MIYRNRRDAGEQLAARLRDYVDRDDVLVLALPRGGVPVAYEVAKALARVAGRLRGVKGLDNQLEVRERAGNVPALQGRPRPLGVG